MSQAESTLELILPDGSSRTVAAGSTPLDVARSIGAGLAKAAIGAELEGAPVDLRTPLAKGGRFKLFTNKNSESGPVIRHSAEHVLADAVQRLWPGTEVDAGRVDHSEKFQYDFRRKEPFTGEDLTAIEAKMREILAENAGFERIEVDREEARKIFGEMGAQLKLERLADIPEGETITLYRHGRFLDLCRGPHVQSTSQIGAIKLFESSSVYYRGDENNEVLQRIYGTAFASAKELEEYEARLEQARARDHRRLGPELDLFSLLPEAPASPFFHPKGALLYNNLIYFMRDLYKEFGYDEVITPQVLDVQLWHTSGHYANYREHMYFTEVEDRQFALKPMNCPTHCLIFGTRMRSYRDLPIRYADFGRLHRYEPSGAVSGLTRVRSFCQDDGHIFCTEDQIAAEMLGVVDMILRVYSVFGFEDVAIELSTRPENRLGSDELWDRAEGACKAALELRGINYELNEGDGAFYGPKIDFKVKDALGRFWQLGTCQLDYQLPARFELKYVGSDGGEHQPVMVHRAMLGSLERFIGILIEHTAGAFPLWLAPVQAKILPLSEKFLDYAGQVAAQLAAAGLRAELDDRSEKLGYKIREAQLQKVPYMLVVGGREQETATVNLRLRSGEELGALPLAEVIARMSRLDAERSREL
jgi:threonyl-tRNA synthetase